MVNRKILCVYGYIYMCICIDVCVFAPLYSVHDYICSCFHIHTNTCTSVCTCAHMHIWNMWMYIYAKTYSTYVCRQYTFMYIWIYTGVHDLPTYVITKTCSTFVMFYIKMVNGKNKNQNKKRNLLEIKKESWKMVYHNSKDNTTWHFFSTIYTVKKLRAILKKNKNVYI